MEDTLIGKQTDRSASGVANGPLKPTSLPIRQRTRGPLSPYPAVNKPILKPTPNPISSMEAELAEVRNAWARYRTTNSRDAVYIYLASVFGIVRFHLLCSMLRPLRTLTAKS
jgi:hypothetical protein